jgi:glucose-6-phosphate isomerase
MVGKQGYASFVIPENVGGRYSVLTAVGLLPIAYAGFDIEQLLQGAQDQAKLLESPKLQENLAYSYAVARNILYQQGKNTEILANFEPALVYLGEWWKQLFGESEGKERKGIFPTTTNFTTDLHSLGQYIQEGRRLLMESFLITDLPQKPLICVKQAEDNDDNLNYLAGKSLEEINHHAYSGTAQAHREGGVPNLTITLADISPYSLGQIIFFFEKTCALSGYLLGVNPFDQPGVECYKKNMLSRLG